MNLTNQDYRKAMAAGSFDQLESLCPFNYHFAFSRLFDEFDGDWSALLNGFDFMAFELPLNPAEYTQDHWQAIADWASECDSERAEMAAFETCPQSVDPIDQY